MPKDNRGLAAEKLTVAIEKIQRLTERAQQAEQLLRNLTPGGSEFQTPGRCAAWVRDELSDLIKRVAETTERAHTAAGEVKRLRELLHDVADYADHKPGCRGASIHRDKHCTCGLWAMQDMVALVLEEANGR